MWKWPADEASGLAHKVVYNISNTTSICDTISIQLLQQNVHTNALSTVINLGQYARKMSDIRMLFQSLQIA